MEVKKLQTERGHLRSVFTKSLNALEDAIAEGSMNAAGVTFKKFMDKSERLFALDDKIKLLTSDDELINELERVEEYRDKYFTAISSFEKINQTMQEDVASVSSGYRRLQLPKIELIKFDGDIKNWIRFWSLFKKIDEDPDLSNDEKFHYLLQSVETRSKAAEYLNSFPPTGENYGKALKGLKNRFAQDASLIEVHVRELLKLVLNQVVGGQAKMNLSTLYNKIESQLRSLEFLGVTSNKYAYILYPLVESAIPCETLKEWSRRKTIIHTDDSTNKKDDDTDKKDDNLQRLMIFLKDEVEGDERVSLARNSFTQDKTGKLNYKTPNDKSTAHDLTVTTSKKKLECIFCDKSHPSQECRKAIDMTLKERKELINKSGVCFSCLKKGHRSKDCRYPPKCVYCKWKHYPILCNNMDQYKPSIEQKKDPENKPDETDSLLCNNKPCEVLLQTLIIELSSPSNDKKLKVRALLDTGSQKSYIKSDVAKTLKLNKIGQCSLKHNLFGGNATNLNHNNYLVSMKNMFNDYDCQVHLLSQTKICGPVNKLRDIKIIKEMKSHNIKISDLECEEYEISLLLGADTLSKLLTGRVIKLTGGLACVETLLGWTIFGQYTVTSLNITHDVISMNNITSLWDLDVIGIRDPVEQKTKEEHELQVYTDFQQNLKVIEDGRYEVKMPWSVNPTILDNNKTVSLKRLEYITKKLKVNNKMKLYDEVFESWLKEGIIEEIEDNDTGHFLPHRPVYKEQSNTTKIRPVFDASAKDFNGMSVNNCLEVGPNLITLIPSILLQFRLEKIGITADIRKAFLQISIDPNDRNYFKFLWYDRSFTKVQTYRHKRVVFGLSSSPFLLNATINYHLKTITSDLPDMKSTADKLSKSFYADNCVSCVDTKEEFNKFMSESKTIMEQGMFELREWGHTTFADTKFDCCKNKECLSVTTQILPVLGMKWDTSKDILMCEIPNHNKIIINDNIVTKRKILSISQQIFDPLGMLSCVTLIPRLLLQECWKLKYQWDEEISPKLKKEFLSWISQLRLLENCSIPRYMGYSLDVVLSLHTFSDASKSAFGACVFLRLEIGCKVLLQFLQAKSRVCPIKEITIARQELIAAVIGLRLSQSVIKAFEFKIDKRYYWTDSMITWYWIQEKGTYKVFVKNRVTEILQTSNKEEWYHLPGDQNPADLLSRGCSVEYFIQSQWLDGPRWLYSVEAEWPRSDYQLDKETIQLNNLSLDQTTPQQDRINELFTKFSSYSKLIRVVAWILRFYKNSTKKDINYDRELNIDEIHSAEVIIFKIIQEDLDDKALKGFHTYTDDQGVKHLQTRLGYGNFEPEFKYPIILPYNNIVVTNLLREQHKKHCHAGVQTLFNILRNKFWIFKCRKYLRKIINQCVTCKRFQTKNCVTPTAPLPANRLNTAKIFQVIGLDLAGPLYLKNGEKSWIVLFTCAVYRAVHLELIQSLSTEAFILSLRRFIARRGRMSTIYCDNGTNFRGASNVLQELDWAEVRRQTNTFEIKWYFSPPSAPWWGGFWERLVRVVKDSLRKVLGKSSLTYEELNTILCGVEAVVNSRPLTYASEFPDEIKPLCPADFIQDIQESDTFDLDKIDSEHLQNKYKYMQTVRDHFKRRFQKEYIGSLVNKQYSKKMTSSTVKCGDIVLIAADNTKRLNWTLGKVTTMLPGKDGICRVAQLKTVKGEITRPVQKLYPLEISVKDFEPEEEFQNDKDDENEDTQDDNDDDQDENISSEDDQTDVQVMTRAGRKVQKPQILDL